MTEAEARIEANRLLATYGEWPGGRAWFVAAGYPDPPRELVEAVKLEQFRREREAMGEGGASYTHFRERPPE